MPVEQIAKVIAEQASKSEMKKPMFEDSHRTSGMELPNINEVGDNNTLEEKFYPDSDRGITDGPQWNEGNLGDENLDEAKLENKAINEGDESKGESPDGKQDNNEPKEQDEDDNEQDDSGEKKGLTDEQKQEIKEKTGWSDEIIDSIGSMEEAEIYMDAGLQEAEIDGKKCLIRDDIDLDQIDEDGISNKERMERGRPPVTKDGQEVELHHIGQKSDSPLAELTTQEHRGVGNDTILHDKNKESEIDRKEFAKERKSHWKSRVGEGGA